MGGKWGPYQLLSKRVCANSREVKVPVTPAPSEVSTSMVSLD